MPDIHLINLCGATNSLWLFAPISQAAIAWAHREHPSCIIRDVDSFVESASKANLKIEV